MDKNLLIVVIIFAFFSCQKEKKCNVGLSPFGVVVKFISSESTLDTIEAKKYIDIEKVYKKYVDNKNLTSYQVWKNKLEFTNNLSKDKKFTNQFKFHNYEFSEVIKNKKASVTFSSKNINSNIKLINYFLELQDDKWIIVDITYTKANK